MDTDTVWSELHSSSAARWAAGSVTDLAFRVASQELKVGGPGVEGVHVEGVGRARPRTTGVIFLGYHHGVLEGMWRVLGPK